MMKKVVIAAVCVFLAAPTYSGTLASDFNSGNSMDADGLLPDNDGWLRRKGVVA